MTTLVLMLLVLVLILSLIILLDFKHYVNTRARIAAAQFPGFRN